MIQTPLPGAKPSVRDAESATITIYKADDTDTPDDGSGDDGTDNETANASVEIT